MKSVFLPELWLHLPISGLRKIVILASMFFRNYVEIYSMYNKEHTLLL